MAEFVERAQQLQELQGTNFVPKPDALASRSNLPNWIGAGFLLAILVADILWVRNLYLARWGYSIEPYEGSLAFQIDWLKDAAFGLVTPILNASLVLALIAWVVAAVFRGRKSLIVAVYFSGLYMMNFLAGWYECFGMGV